MAPFVKPCFHLPEIHKSDWTHSSMTKLHKSTVKKEFNPTCQVQNNGNSVLQNAPFQNGSFQNGNNSYCVLIDNGRTGKQIFTLMRFESAQLAYQEARIVECPQYQLCLLAFFDGIYEQGFAMLNIKTCFGTHLIGRRLMLTLQPSQQQR